MKDSIFQHACLRAHTQALQQNESEYMMKLMAEMNTMSPAVKGTCFAALHLTGSHKALNETVQFWDIVSLYKMFSCLDAPRQARQLSEKIERIEVQHPHLIEMEEKTMLESTSSKRKSEEVATDVPIKRKRPRKIDGLRKKYDELQKEMNAHQCTACKDIHDNSAVAELISSASVSGSLARKVRTLWAPKLKPDYLEFVMLEMPKKTVWQFVSDLAHFKPADFSVPYFLADIFGESIPEDSFVYAMRNVMDAEKDDIAGTFRDVAARFPQVYKSYAFLRTKSHLTRSKAIVELLAENIPIDTAIWYFEELYSVARSTPQILAKRIQDNDLLNLAAIRDSKVFTYGKLLERLLMFRKMNCRKMAEALMDVAASRLDALKERYMDNTRKKAVAVFGDASSSMTTAIEAAAIISSIVSTTLDGELSFFASDLVNSPHKKPSSVEETLEICTKIRANGCTNLASCLWPYYEQKKLVDTIVMVTDEFENSLCLGLHFAELLKKYKETVNPRVVLVLVRVGTGSKNFQNSLRANDIEAKVVMIDNSRPDLTKFDGLVGQIAAASQAVSDGDMGQSAKDADVEVCEDFVLVDDGN